MSRTLIQTDRCDLRLATHNDAEAIIDFYLKNENHFTPWDPVKPSYFYSREFWLKRISDALQEFERGRSLRLLICSRQDDQIVGMINFTNFERGPFQNCRLGYKMGEAFQGKGLMLESLRESITFIFDKLHFHRIEANYMPCNERSGRLLKRLGFVEHGIAENYLQIAGLWQSHMLTSLVNENYAPAISIVASER